MAEGFSSLRPNLDIRQFQINWTGNSLQLLVVRRGNGGGGGGGGGLWVAAGNLSVLTDLMVQTFH